MKKEALIIIGIILIVLFVLVLATSQYDNARARNNIEEAKEDHIVTQIAYANWIDSDVAFESDKNCLNVDKYIFSDYPRLPTFKFDTKLELDEFKNKYKDTFTMDQSYNEIASFNDVIAKYDDEFFKNHSLMLTHINTSSGSFRYGITNVKKDNGTLILRVEKLNDPETYTDDIAGWILLAEVNKEYIKDCTSFDTQDWEGYPYGTITEENSFLMEE